MNKITYRKVGNAYRIAQHTAQDETSAGALLNFTATIAQARALYPSIVKWAGR